MKLCIEIANRTYTVALNYKRSRVMKKVKRNSPAPFEEFEPNREHQLWLLNNYTDEELQYIADHTYGCIYGKCEGCNRDCGANDIRDLLAHPLTVT